MSEENPPPITPAAGGLESACGRCARPGAVKFGDEFICDDCYVACGSCCAEWFEEREPKPAGVDSHGFELRNTR
ncbi:MAG: hypothetical protein JNM65_00410 [Verrucomicrobiaceae bacterium]|nr:hypothetical protein [Verrucomicrobiaceae bacterium]